MKKLVNLCSLALLFAVLISGCSGTSDKKESSETEPDNSPNTIIKDKDDTMKDLLESRHTLHFNKDGKFKILVLSDIHGHAKTLDKETKSNIKTLVDKENPDLVLFDGDNTWQIKDESTLKSCIGEMVSYIEEKKIPWAHTYGNHDAEGSNVPKKRQQAIYESFEYCISKAGDSKLTGIGNYVLPVYSSDDDKVGFAVWVLDSGSDIDPNEKKALFPSKFPYQGMPDSNYDYIHFDQINWYFESSKALEEYNGGKKVPGIMAFHIPLQESFTAWENRSKLKYTGDKREYVCASAVNSGMFSALMQRGDIKAVVNGHDHINDFMIEYNGIKLCQVSTPTNENIYHDDTISGGRVFVINESSPKNVETYMSYVREQGNTDDFSNAKPLANGSGTNFEGTLPEFSVRGFDNNTSGEAHVDEIKLAIASGKGYNGSDALSVTREKWYNSNTGNNAEFTWKIPEYGTLADNQYVRIWIDLKSGNIDFRKAGLGLVVQGKDSSPYRTDDYDKSCPFYYLAEGTDEWVTLSTGTDGCFGKGDSQSVKDFKGWLAFPVKYMLSGSRELSNDSVITGFYFYFSFAESSMAGKQFYIDDMTLVKDYKDFN